MTILKTEEFKALHKPSNEDSFYWYVAGYIDSKSLSYDNIEALKRYQRMGFRRRLLKSQKEY
jgi:hypothetical protein